MYDTRSLHLEGLTVDEASKEGVVAALYQEGETTPIKEGHTGDSLAIILTNTAFHAEGGGQLGDTGRLISDAGIFDVENTKKLPDGTTIHLGTVESGAFSVGQAVTFEVNLDRKADIARNHTATHLLHAALKKVLGGHVNQAGSYVGPDRLRFDFSHFSPLTAEEVSRVEDLVNEAILDAVDVQISEEDIDKAKENGGYGTFW